MYRIFGGISIHRENIASRFALKVVSPVYKMDWMYKKPTLDTEAYLLGKRIDKSFEQQAVNPDGCPTSSEDIGKSSFVLQSNDLLNVILTGETCSDVFQTIVMVFARSIVRHKVFVWVFCASFVAKFLLLVLS